MKKINIGLLLIRIAYFIISIGGTVAAFIGGVEYGISMLCGVLILTGLLLSYE